MNEDLVEEIIEEVAALIGSGFYSRDETLEIIVSTKFDEKIEYETNWEAVTDFDKLKSCFKQLNRNNIIAIHNAGYTLDEGVHDSFEVFHHLKTKNLSPEGFCFYNFQDIEFAIKCNLLNIAFGDFENNEKKSLELGKKIANILEENGFSINWNENINTPIKIEPFIWKKRFDNEEYEMEGAFNSFLENRE